MAITVLDIEKRTIGWSPGLKRSVYINESTQQEVVGELKRIREAEVVTAYDQMNDKTVFIELGELEQEQFNTVYDQYLESGGQIFYTRNKEGRKMRSVFMFDKSAGIKESVDVPEKKLLFG
ncbi:hypothetical protein C5S42_02230 [Candidatus Methanomarinus sp.]|nr:hypothetical protein C5S42_02230 [ANME-2 cluster archaeon]